MEQRFPGACVPDVRSIWPDQGKARTVVRDGEVLAGPTRPLPAHLIRLQIQEHHRPRVTAPEHGRAMPDELREPNYLVHSTGDECPGRPEELVTPGANIPEQRGPPILRIHPVGPPA